MTMPDLPWDGGCRCGRVRFRVTKTPLITMVCHCRGCQRMTASAFSTTVILPADGFAVVQGDTVIGGIHGDQGRHHHCDWCKGWLFTTAKAMPAVVNVRATLLDDASWFEPFAETQTAEMLPWAKTPARHSYERFPPEDDFAKLIEEFAAQ